MEGGLHRGRWNKKAPVCTTLLLMCMFTPALTLLQPTEEPKPTEEFKCPPGDFKNDQGICCNKCSRGFKLFEECHAEGQRSICIPCPSDQYTDKLNYSPTCRSCRVCKESKNEEQVSACRPDQNTVCKCKEGFYKYSINSDTYDCIGCKKCGLNEKEKQKCTSENNTVCECKENYYRVKNKCEPCKNCTAKCKHLCPNLPLNTIAPPEPNGLLYTIVGVLAVTAIFLVLGILITYKVTKRSTQRNLQKPSSPSPDESPDSLTEIMIPHVEPSINTNVYAAPTIPVNELEQPSSLPDCVPKIPDLIYSVLDLVPVLQVKQLVRSLGVRDVEIEQAEMDHRSCREAHYQMMRLWAERGSRAGGKLHKPLLQELLDELTKMHLWQAAEELETKYNIQ